MDIFTEKQIEITVKAWTVDFSDARLFEENKDADSTYRRMIPYFATSQLEEIFRKLGYTIRLSAFRGVKTVHISRKDDKGYYLGKSELTLREGDTLTINNTPTGMDVIEAS